MRAQKKGVMLIWPPPRGERASLVIRKKLNAKAKNMVVSF
jgi:hypothetical protein